VRASWIFGSAEAVDSQASMFESEMEPSAAKGICDVEDCVRTKPFSSTEGVAGA